MTKRLVLLNECEASSKEWHRIVMLNRPIRRAWGVKHLPKEKTGQKILRLRCAWLRMTKKHAG